MKILQFRKFIRIHWLLLALLLVGTAWLLKPERIASAQLGQQSFFEPETWIHDFTREQGWNPEHPRLLADVNGDHRQDVVGFGNDGVWLGLSTGTSFAGPSFALGDFGFHGGGWRTHLHVRTAGDVNGDQLDDIVGFGNLGVYRALSTGNGFGPVAFVVDDFGYDQGWRNDKHVRLLADVNGDHRKDIVGFGTHGVWVSLSLSGAGDFSAPFFAVGNFGFNQGWNNDEHVRTTADVNGDGLQDIVGFGDHGVWLSLATGGGGFQSPQFVLAEFALYTGGWQVSRHPRVMADVNKDGRDDIVGFGYHGVWISLSTGNGFTAPQFAIADFGYNQGWRVGRDPIFEDDGHAHTGCDDSCANGSNPRFVVDLNGDGYLDVVGFGHEAIYRALGGPNGFGTTRAMIRDLVTASGHPWSGYEDVVPTFSPRLAGDVNGDGMTDLVAFDRDDVKVVRSSDLPPQDPPKAPTNGRVVSSTATSLSIEWDDNSLDERRFFIYFEQNPSNGQTFLQVRPKDSKSAVLGDLEPNTKYCFQVHAENIFGISAGSRTACGTTSEKPPPTPTPTPDQFGFSRLDVVNCNSEGHTLALWTLSSQNVWTQHGTAPSAWTPGGSCPGTTTPVKVPLPDGQLAWFVAVDLKLPGCGVNDPTIVFCQKAKQQFFGKANGPVFPFLVN